MGERWRPERVTALAPDSASDVAGRRLAIPTPWSDVGYAYPLLWGACQGSGSTPYSVVVDVSDRKKPRTLGSLPLNTLTRVVCVRGNTLFVAGHTKGIAAVDVSNPQKPAVAAWYDTVDDGRGVFVDDEFVYAASGSGGVYVFKYLH